MKIARKVISLILLTGITLSMSVFANNSKPFAYNRVCKDFKWFPEVKEKISSLDEKFEWNNPDCKILYTKTLLPRKDESGKFHFEKGLQLFVYQNYQLKFICLPGWICKAW